jgi:hypothetical protein
MVEPPPSPPPARPAPERPGPRDRPAAVDGRAGRPSTPAPAAGPRWWVALAVLGLLGVAIFLVLRAPTDPLPGAAEREPGLGGASAAPPALGGQGSVPVPAPRCRLDPGAAPFRIGDAAPASSAAAPKPAQVDAADEEEPLAPPTVVIGRAARARSGYAIGVRRDAGGGAVAEVALLGTSGGPGKLLALGKTRGDLDAPLVLGDGDGLVAALLEPQPSGFALRIAKVAGDEVRWAAELPVARGESLAFDLALGEAKAVAAWDEIERGGERSEIRVAVLDRASLGVVQKPTVLSGTETDAEQPQLVPRPAGFWLAYVARRAVKLPPQPNDKDLRRDPQEDQHPAELIEPSWLELVPLDDSGARSGPARPVTPRDGHVQTFDLAADLQGGALLAWRDDDTPTGAEGGRLGMISVSMAGVGEPRVVAAEDVGLGAPLLLGGWLAASDAEGRIRLAPLLPSGELAGELRTEPGLGPGQVLAAEANTLLVARPTAHGAEVVLARCELRDGG